MINNIDFAQLYRAHLARSGRVSKSASEWDSKAADMRAAALDSPYRTEFVRRVQCRPGDTVLDVGCGPGTIGLALAPLANRVYGLDYSQGMLDAMMQNAADLQLGNVEPILAAWEDDWAAVPVCDISVVSRAAIVADMDAALDKLNQHTRARIYLTQLVGGRFVSREIEQLLGREDRSFPDHMYILNMLYQRNIHATLDYIESPSRLAGCNSADELLARVRWSFGELSTEDERRIAHWYQSDPEYARRGGEPMRWAFISWSPWGTRLSVDYSKS